MTLYVVYALAILGALRLGSLLVAWLSPQPDGSRPEWLSPPERDAPYDFLDVMGAHLDAAVLSGNRLDHLANGVEIFPAMLEAIEGARETVSFLTYIYWRGEIARRLASALAETARRGVEVRVLLDAYGAHRMEDGLATELESAGVRVAWFRPLSWYQVRRLNNRTHRKILVVDGKEGFTGGVGIAEEWDGDARNPKEWRDDHFRIVGPAVRYLQGAFADDWREATGDVLVDPRLFRDPEPDGPSRVMPLVTSPIGGRAPIAFLYWMAIHQAARRLDIATPYFLPDPDVVAALARAVERGVVVRLLVPCEHNDSRLLRLASLSYYPDLIDAGIELYEYQPTMLHSKRVAADGRWTIVGSANFDTRSFELNNEAVLLVDDQAFAELMHQRFERDLERARRITMEAVRDRSLAQRLATSTALMLRGYL